MAARKDQNDGDDGLDDLLASALDEVDLDDADANDRPATNLSAAARAAAAQSAQAARTAEEQRAAADAAGANAPDFEASAADLLKEMQDPEFARTLEETMKLFSGADGAGAGGEGGASGPAGGDEDMARALRSLMEASRGAEGTDAAQAEALGDDIMRDMMKQFEALGGKDDFEKVLGGMMGQLLGKDVMYPPLKEVCDKFPAWLADNEERLGADEYSRYGRQYEMYQRIVATYESEPDNMARISELFEQLQEFGQPPAEIIQELSPGLEMDENGIPKLPGLGAPGALPPGMDPNQCPQQ